MATMASMAPMGGSDGYDGFGGFDGVDGSGFGGFGGLDVSRDSSKKRELSIEMLRYSPSKTWLCSSTKQSWEADGSRSSRRVDVVKVKELMGSQIWAMVATMASMVWMVWMVWMAQGGH